MKLIVGLGNPGKEYKNTRHNVGFDVVDEYLKKHNQNVNKSKFEGMYSELIINGEKVIFLEPQKYMNLSGEVVRKYVDYFKINIEDNKMFRLYGSDLCTDLKLTPWEAALGTRVDVKTIDGETRVYVPQGIQSGEKVRIPSKGYKDGKGGRGDLVAEVKIMVPKKLELDEQEMFEKLKEMSTFNPRND